MRSFSIFLLLLAILGWIDALRSWHRFRHRDAYLGNLLGSLEVSIRKAQGVWFGFWFILFILSLLGRHVFDSTFVSKALISGFLLLSLRHLFLVPMSFLEFRGRGLWTGTRGISWSELSFFRLFWNEKKSLYQALFVGAEKKLLFNLRSSEFSKEGLEEVLKEFGLKNQWPDDDPDQTPLEKRE